MPLNRNAVRGKMDEEDKEESKETVPRPGIDFTIEQPPAGGAGKRKTQLNSELIEEICDYVNQGGTDIVICRVIGIHQETFVRWKRLGKEAALHGAKHDPIYIEFYKAYEQARGKRELHWLKLVSADAKWLLIHHPDTKMVYAEPRNQKLELSGILSPVEREEKQIELDKRVDATFRNIDKQLVLSNESEDEVRGESEEAEQTDSSE